MFRYIKVSEIGLQTSTQHTQHNTSKRLKFVHLACREWCNCSTSKIRLQCLFNLKTTAQERKKKGMNTSHSDKKSTGFGIQSLYGNCPCKQRLDSGQDIIYKQMVQTIFPTKLPPLLHKSICHWGKANFPTTLVIQWPLKAWWVCAQLQNHCAYFYGTCTHFWAHPESKAYRIPRARREVRVFHIIHVLLLWLCNCRCFLLDCLHLWGDWMRNATGDRKKTSMSRDEKTHTLKEKKKIKAQIQFLKLSEKAQAIQTFKERGIKIKETLGKLSFSQAGTGLLNTKPNLTAGKHNLGWPLSGRLELKSIRSFPLTKRRFFAVIAQVSITCSSPFLNFLSKMKDKCIKPQSISKTVSRTSHTSYCCPIPCQASPVLFSSYQKGLRFLLWL